MPIGWTHPDLRRGRRIHPVLAALTALLLCACSDAGTGPPTVQPPTDNAAAFREVFSVPEDACKSCHPVHYEDWSISMHAYSFVDPVMFRLNEIGQERSGNRLDQFCVSCHSPIASRLGETPPGFNPAGLSRLARQGVSCDVCHKVKSWRKGHGIDEFWMNDFQIGTISDPSPNGVHQSIYDPAFARSDVCSGCHDIVTPNGVRVERTSTEWENSVYPRQGIFCQTCHMPRYKGRAAPSAPVRDSLHSHVMAGVDVPLTDFPGRERMLAAVEKQLQISLSMTVDAPASLVDGDQLRLRVVLFNHNTGHSIPSGSTFERQMWLQVLVIDPQRNDTVFASGLTDPNGDLLNSDSEYVKEGTLPLDSNLALFNGIPLRDGVHTPFFWEAHEVKFRTVPALEERNSIYRIPAGSLTSLTEVRLEVRLFFRAFPPHFLRKIDLAELVDRLPIFLMEEEIKNISIGG